MWKMTLKQRRRHRELEEAFARLKKDPYIVPPEDYEFGKDETEDEKYREVARQLGEIMTEMHEIEEIARRGH